MDSVYTSWSLLTNRTGVVCPSLTWKTMEALSTWAQTSFLSSVIHSRLAPLGIPSPKLPRLQGQGAGLSYVCLYPMQQGWGGQRGTKISVPYTAT
jgi:hypothetical protein